MAGVPGKAGRKDRKATSEGLRPTTGGCCACVSRTMFSHDGGPQCVKAPGNTPFCCVYPFPEQGRSPDFPTGTGLSVFRAPVRCPFPPVRYTAEDAGPWPWACGKDGTDPSAGIRDGCVRAAAPEMVARCGGRAELSARPSGLPPQSTGMNQERRVFRLPQPRPALPWPYPFRRVPRRTSGCSFLISSTGTACTKAPGRRAACGKIRVGELPPLRRKSNNSREEMHGLRPSCPRGAFSAHVGSGRPTPPRSPRHRPVARLRHIPGRADGSPLPIPAHVWPHVYRTVTGGREHGRPNQHRVPPR